MFKTVVLGSILSWVRPNIKNLYLLLDVQFGSKFGIYLYFLQDILDE